MHHTKQRGDTHPTTSVAASQIKAQRVRRMQHLWQRGSIRLRQA
jgi:hypothetical protein